MPRESNLEVKVGLFVLLGLAALTYFVFSINDSAVLKDGIAVKAIFEFANGVKKGAPVRVAGVTQGIVQNIGLFFDRQDSKTKAEIFMWIKHDIKIPADSTVMINQLGFLGEKYVEIIPGIDTKRFLENNQTVIGKDPIAQEIISDRIMDVADKLDAAIEGVNIVIHDETNLKSLNAALQNLSRAADDLRNITGHVRNGKGTIGKLFYDDRLYDDLEGMMADLKANPWKILYRPKTKDMKRSK